jgi:hypothetical protein
MFRRPEARSIVIRASGGNPDRTEFGSQCRLRALPPLPATRIRRDRRSHPRRPVERARRRSRTASESQPSPSSQESSSSLYGRLHAAREQLPGLLPSGSEACQTVFVPCPCIQLLYPSRRSRRPGRGLEGGDSLPCAQLASARLSRSRAAPAQAQHGLQEEQSGEECKRDDQHRSAWTFVDTGVRKARDHPDNDEHKDGSDSLPRPDPCSPHGPDGETSRMPGQAWRVRAAASGSRNSSKEQRAGGTYGSLHLSSLQLEGIRCPRHQRYACIRGGNIRGKYGFGLSPDAAERG